MNIIFIQKDFENSTIICLKEIYFNRKRSNSIIVFDENIESNIIKNLFKSLWQEKILNVAILTYLNTGLQVIGFNPYFQNFHQILDIDKVFYFKMRNLNNYTLNLLLVRSEDFSKVRVVKKNNSRVYMGKDAMTILNIIKHCNGNFSVIDLHDLYYTENPFRPINKNMIENEKTAIIQRHDGDVFFDSMEMYINAYTDVVYPHAKDDYKVLIPAAKFKTQDESFLILLKEGFMYFILFFVIICPLVWFLLIIIEQYLKQNKNRKSDLLLNIFFNNFRLFLGSSINIFTVNFTENMFFSFLLFSNLIVNNYFQCILKSIMTISVSEPEINTIQQLAKSKLVVYSVATLINETKNNFKITNQTLIPNFEVFPLKMNTMLFRDFPKNSCVMMNEDKLLAFKELRPSFHIVKESVIPAYTAFHVAKGSPYYFLLEKYVPMIIEAGLYNFWKKQNSFSILLEYEYSDDTESKVAFESLSLKHFWGTFYLYFIGIVISFVFLILECFIDHFKRRLRYSK